MPSKKPKPHRKRSRVEAGALDENALRPQGLGPESAGRSGDDQGLPRTARSEDESVEELAAEGQPYEAAIVEGVEEAGNHQEEPTPIRSERRAPSLLDAEAALADLEITNKEGGD